MARSLRARITLSATAAVALVLVVGAVLAIVALRGSLLSGVEQLAASDASTVADRFDSDGSAALTTEESDGDDRFVQVVVDGDVRAASDELEGMAPLTTGERTFTVEVDGDTYLAVAEQDGGVLVVAGRSTDDAEQVVSTLVPLVVGAIPVLLALLGVTTWIVVGRALAPVDRMRREVDAVTADNLDRRVAEPGTADEVGRLATTMNSMLARLDESQQAQRRFISDASHELRSPLASLRQYAEVARSYPERMTAAELSDAIADEGGRLEAIVSGMLVLARADEGTLRARRRDVDIDDLVLSEAGRLRASGRLSIDSGGVTAARVKGDELMLGQVVRNLADNAARHAASHVSFATSETSGLVTLTVDDDGAGIAEVDRERVFERFVRLDEARARDAGGSGLGLAIVREIVTVHGGTVRASPSPSGGARFTVTLPA